MYTQHCNRKDSSGCESHHEKEIIITLNTINLYINNTVSTQFMIVIIPFSDSCNSPTHQLVQIINAFMNLHLHCLVYIALLVWLPHPFTYRGMGSQTTF